MSGFRTPSWIRATRGKKHKIRGTGTTFFDGALIHPDDDDDVVLAERAAVLYECPRRHAFTEMFAADALPPRVFVCRKHGVDAVTQAPSMPIAPPAKPRTHMDQVGLRRKPEERARLLAEQLQLFREGRLPPIDTWLKLSRDERDAIRNRPSPAAPANDQE